MHKKYLSVIFLFLQISASCVSAYALEVYTDSIYVSVGQKAGIKVSIDSSFSDNVSFRGIIKLGNSTVFYPENLVVTSQSGLLEKRLEKLNDSIYFFHIELSSYLSHTTVFSVYGEALAGSDSLCLILFDSLQVNDETAAQAYSLVTINSIYTPLPYVRIARLGQNYPNPVRLGQKTIFEFTIDKSSDIKFYLIDILGKKKLLRDLGTLEKGFYTYEFIPDYRIAAGAYWMFMESNSGLAYKKIMISK